MSRLGLFSAAGRDIPGAVNRARRAEELGYDSVWVNQMADARDGSLVLAAYASATERIGLGTGVLPIYTRHPSAMVQMAATLDEISHGRLILGLGVSHRVTVEGLWGMSLDQPVDAMREYLQIVTGGIRQGMVSVEGSHFTARWGYSGPRRPEMQIMIAALGPRMLDLAGELADGVVLWMCSPEYIATEVVPRVRAARERSGRSMEGFEIVAAVPVCLTADAAAGRAAFTETVERYASLPFYRRMLDASGFGPDLEAGRITDGMIDQLSGIGDGEAVRAAIERYRAAGTTLPAAGPFAGHPGAAGFEATMEAAIAV